GRVLLGGGAGALPPVGGRGLAAAFAGPAGELGDPPDHELGVQDAEHAGELYGHLVLGAAVPDAGDHGGGFVQGGGAARRGVEVVAGDDLPQCELEQRGAGFDQVDDGLVALGEPQLARVHAVRRDGDVGLGGELLVVLEGAQGGL